MKDYNRKKGQQLGMPHGTAAGRLRKAIMFELLKETGKNVCFQCGKIIEDVSDLSIEHIVPWLDSEDPKGLFFDYGNIAFSHLSCNSSAARKPTKGMITIKPHGTGDRYRQGCRCRECTHAATVERRKYTRNR